MPIRKRLKAYWKATVELRDGVEVVLSPFIWSINFLPKGRLYQFFSLLNHRLFAKRINRHLSKCSPSELIFVNSFNFYFPDLPRFLNQRISLNIYHCIDPMVKKYTLRHGEYLEERAAGKADLIISTAPALQKKFLFKGFRNSYLIPNAANYTLFAGANDPLQNVHPALQKISGRLLGFLGHVERRTNFTLLQKLLRLLPEWKVVMVGPADYQCIPHQLVRHPRFFLIDPVKHQEAPSVIKRFDVCMIPFSCDEVSSSVYPLKLYEYLAAGKPVVTTRFNPEVLEGLEDIIHIADSAEQFAEQVQTAYQNDGHALQRKRLEAAARNSWEERADQFHQLILQHLPTERQHAA